MKRGEKKAQKVRLEETEIIVRQFCIGSLKLWKVDFILESMLRLLTDLKVHALKMTGTGWAVTSDLNYLEQLVLVWIKACFPRCVRDSSALQAFTKLISDLPNREKIQLEIVKLSQKHSSLISGEERRKLKKKSKKSTFFSSSFNNFKTMDFMQVDILEIPAAELALELTRVSANLMREIPLDKLVRGDLSFSTAPAPAAAAAEEEKKKGAKKKKEKESSSLALALDLPPLFVLRTRTERLSHWTASVVVGEKILSRRIGLFSKLIAIAARLVDLHNLHDAVAMVSALHNPAVSRLKMTVSGAGDTVNKAFEKLTNLIRPPYQNLRKKLIQWSENSETQAFLPPLEVLLQDMQKLDEVEKNFVPHPENSELLMGNIWKMNLLGTWVSAFVAGFSEGRYFEFESETPSQRSLVLSSFVKVLPDVYDDDTLWAMSKKLETSAQQN